MYPDEFCDEEIGFTGKDYKIGEVSCSSWKEAVLNQEHVGRGKVMLEKGVNKIQISAREAGIVLQRLVLYPIDTVKKRVLPWSKREHENKQEGCYRI